MSFTNAPSAMLESASIDPTERSNPPASMTNVRPIATTHRIAALVSSASMFAEVKNRSCVMENVAKSPMKRTSTAKKRCCTRDASRRVATRLTPRVPLRSRVIVASSASSRFNRATIRPRCMTRIRSQRSRSSAVSEELTRIASPRCFAASSSV